MASRVVVDRLRLVGLILKPFERCDELRVLAAEPFVNGARVVPATYYWSETAIGARVTKWRGLKTNRLPHSGAAPFRLSLTGDFAGYICGTK